MTREQEIIKEQLQTPQWVGEDGGCVISGEYTQKQAHNRIRKFLVQEGDYDTTYLPDIEDIRPAYFRLPEPGDDVDLAGEDEVEWFVTERKTPYKLWRFWG